MVQRKIKILEKLTKLLKKIDRRKSRREMLSYQQMMLLMVR